MISRDKQLILFLACYAVLLFLSAGRYTLIGSTEERYSEIAREMNVSGNYMEPTLDGIKHFHKPPLAYWMTAAGLRLFGLNELGARSFVILAAILTLIVLYRIGRLFLDQTGALNAALILASSFLFQVVSRIVATDMYLVLFVTLSQYFLLRQIYVRKQMRNVLLYSVFLGLGFMTKGHIVFAFTLLPYFVAKAFDRSHRKVFSTGAILVGIAVFSAIALPWYAAVIMRHPDLVDYFLRVQIVERVATDKFMHGEPFWYFLWILAAGFFPFTLYFVRAIVKGRDLDPRIRILFVYVAVPLLVFSLSRSKLAPYILPFFGLASVITASVISRSSSGLLDKLSRYFVLLLFVALGASGFFYPPLRGAAVMLAASCSGLLLLWLIFQKKIRDKLLVPAVASALVALSFLGYLALPALEPQLRGYKGMAETLNRLDPQRSIDVLTLHNFLSSLSFYRNRPAVAAFAETRELRFQENSEYRKYVISTAREMAEYLEGRDQLFLVAHPHDAEGFSKDYSFACSPVYHQKKHTAYLCRSLVQETPRAR